MLKSKVKVRQKNILQKKTLENFPSQRSVAGGGQKKTREIFPSQHIERRPKKTS